MYEVLDKDSKRIEYNHMINHVKSNKRKSHALDIICYPLILNKIGNEVTLFDKENNQ